MDFHLKQWRNQQHESEQLQQQQEHPSAKIPKFLLDPQHQQNPSPPATSSARPLFLPEPNDNTNNTKISILSAFPDSTTSPPATTRVTKMGSYFSLAQFQELELQALIYRYMLAGAAVPPELLQPIKKSLLLHSPSYFLHHPLQHYSFCQTPLLQTGYWGRGSMDPEPGRCRRTDGKKWRCSRDVVVGQKYCERHVHRGRNRSRKPVEIPTPTSTNPAASTTAVGGGLAGSGATAHIAAASPLAAAMANGSSFTVPGQSPPIDLFHLNNNSCSESKAENKVLRHFFDDWPRSVQDSENGGNNASQMNSGTSLSISMPGNGNSSSDVSLKLSTGVGEEPGRRGSSRRDQPQLNWGGGYGANQMSSMGGPLAEALRSSTSASSPTSVLHQMPRRSMGGPLAEALRSSTSTSSPTSVLHQMPRRSASETSYIST